MWCKTIYAAFYTTWPGLSAKLMRKHVNVSGPSVKGHLNQHLQNIRSTKLNLENPHHVPGQDKLVNNIYPRASELRTKFVFADIQIVTGQVYLEQTGSFLVSSRKGNKYIMVIYNYDGKSIDTELMQSRSSSEIIQAHKKIHNKMAAQGLNTKLQSMDNEDSSSLNCLIAA